MSKNNQNIRATLTTEAVERYGQNLSKGEKTVAQLIESINLAKRAHQVDIARKPVNLVKSTRRKTGGKRKQKKRKTAKRRYKR